MQRLIWLGLLVAVISGNDLHAAPVPVILDTDMGNDIDDPFALAMLHGLADRGECRILAVTSSKPHPLSVPLCEAINMAYGRPNLPLGAMRSTAKTGDGPYLPQVLGAKAKTKFPHSLQSSDDAPEAIGLLRKTLVNQPDRSVVLICIGFSTNMAALLKSSADATSPLTGRQLITQKVARLVMMAGKFSEAKPEYNVEMDIPACRTVLADWPTPIVLSPSEVGMRQQYLGEPKFDNPPSQAAKSLMMAIDIATFGRPHGFPGWDLTAVLVAVRPDRQYFKLSPPGTVRVDDNGVTTFTPSATGTHRYLIVDPEQTRRIAATFRELAESRPE